MERHLNTPPTSTEATKELRDVFDPLCELTAEVTRPDTVYNSNQEVVEHALMTPIRHIPSSLPSDTLPSDILVDIDLSVLPAIYEKERRDPLDEDGPSGMGQLVDTIFDNWQQRHPHSATKREFVEGELMRKVLLRNASSFNMSEWKEWEAYFVGLPEDEQERIDSMRSVRGYNIGKWEASALTADMARTAAVAHLHNDMIPSSEVYSDLIVPIGEYGEELATEMLQTTAIMQAVAQKRVHSSAEGLTVGHEDALRTFTARGAGAAEADADSTMAALHEGILSIAQTLAILTCEKVDGYEDPHELVRDIVDAGLVSRLARFSPMGFVGPMALSGRFIAGSLVRTEDGIKFSDEFEQFLKQEKAAYMARLMVESEVEQGADQRLVYHPLGKVCPVANIGGGIDKMSITFRDLLEVSGHIDVNNGQNNPA